MKKRPRIVRRKRRTALVVAAPPPINPGQMLEDATSCCERIKTLTDLLEVCGEKVAGCLDPQLVGGVGGIIGDEAVKLKGLLREIHPQLRKRKRLC